MTVCTSCGGNHSIIEPLKNIYAISPKGEGGTSWPKNLVLFFFFSLLIPETYQEDLREWLEFAKFGSRWLWNTPFGGYTQCVDLYCIWSLPKCPIWSVLLTLLSSEIQVSRRNLKTHAHTYKHLVWHPEPEGQKARVDSLAIRIKPFITWPSGLPAQREQEACLWAQDCGMQNPKQLLAEVLSFVLETRNNVNSLLNSILVNKYPPST